VAASHNFAGRGLPALHALREGGESSKLKEMEQALRDSEARFGDLNQELQAFRYSTSHDFRAPLRHILGYVHILQSVAGPRLDKTSRQHLETIAQSAMQMGGMIDALLELSRVGRTEVRFQRVSLTALLDAARQELSHESKGRDIDWQVGDLPEVQGDPLKLRQAIVCLLANAIKYTRTRRKAKIQVGASRRGDEAIIFVRDNGVGFPMKCAGKLFGVFQRCHPPGQFEGTGIGLAIVRRIVHQHGGRTWAKGKADGGATFYVSIPKPAETAKWPISRT
jgi:light-regulated signal transduction histidine kinase (bacteriophytochrome)